MAGLVVGSSSSYVGDSYVGASDAADSVSGVGSSTQGQSSVIAAVQNIAAIVSSGQGQTSIAAAVQSLAAVGSGSQGQTSTAIAASFVGGDSAWVIKYRRSGRRG